MGPMAHPSGPRSLIGLGDAIGVLATLGLEAVEDRRFACDLLGYTWTEPLPPHVSPASETKSDQPVVTEQPPGQAVKDRTPPIAAKHDFETEPSAVDLPPTSRAIIEELWLPDAPKPDRDPLTADPAQGSAPAKHMLLPPRYERAILTDLCQVETASAELHVATVIKALAKQKPLTRLPQVKRLRTAPRVELLLDVAQSMQVFEDDLNHIADRLRHLLAGHSKIAVGRWVGIPQIGQTALARFPSLAPGQSARQVAILVTDLSLGGDRWHRSGFRTSVRTLHRWGTALAQTQTPLSVLVPMSTNRWHSAIPASMRGTEWSRRARPGQHHPSKAFHATPDRCAALAAHTVPVDDVRRIARACSLAVRITPALLRELRLRLLPHLGPEAEPEFWASPLVREASTTAASLMPEDAEALRAELPSYRQLIDWLKASGSAPATELAPLEPIGTIDDGFDDLWPHQFLPGPVASVPASWSKSALWLKAIFRRQGVLEASLAAFPDWRAELRALEQGHGILFAERIRQIDLQHVREMPHLNLEEALLWHGFNTQFGDKAATARADALIAAIEATLVDPKTGLTNRRSRDWVKRRQADLPEAIRQRPSFQRLMRAMQQVNGPQPVPVAYDPVDVYVVRKPSQLLLSLEPLADAFRIRAVRGEGVPITVRQGAFTRSVRLRRSINVTLQPAATAELLLQTLNGDLYRLPASIENAAAASTPADCLAEVAADRDRLDWIAVMRWAGRAADHAEATPAEQLDATVAFATAAKRADLRVATALGRIAELRNRLISPDDPLLGKDLAPRDLIALAVAEVELLMLDSQLALAIDTAERTLDAVQMREPEPRLWQLAARIRTRMIAALLRAGRWQDAQVALEATWLTTTAPAEALPAIEAWQAVALAEFGAQRGIRRDGRRALRALSAAANSGDPVLAYELADGVAEMERVFAPLASADQAITEALALAQRLGDLTAIRTLIRRVARSSYNSGREAAAITLLRPLVADLPNIRSPRTRWGILHEQSYQERLGFGANAVSLAEESLTALPVEEKAASAHAYEALAAALRRSPEETATEATAIRLFAETGQLAQFVDQAASIAFDADGNWVNDLLQNEAGEGSPQDCLRRLARKIGVSQSGINIYHKIAKHAENDRRAEEALRNSLKIATTLGAHAYVAHIGLVAATRFSLDNRSTDKALREARYRIALHWLESCVGILEAAKRAPARVVLLRLLQCFTHHSLQNRAEAERIARQAHQEATTLDLSTLVVIAEIQLAVLAHLRGDAIEASELLRRARARLSDDQGRRRGHRSEEKSIFQSNFDYGTGSMILDAAETFRNRTTGQLTEFELSFADDLLWFAIDFYGPSLKDETSGALNDLWYVVSQFQTIAVPNAAASWDLLVEAEAERDPSSSRIGRFRTARDWVTGLLSVKDDAPPAETDGYIRSEHQPLVSGTVGFLSFQDLHRPDQWLRGSVADTISARRSGQILRSTALPFWPGAMLVAVGIAGRRDKSERFALAWPGDDFVPLDWTNEPIYAAIERHPLAIASERDAILYCKFFFHFVRGQLGRFIFVETLADVPWIDPSAKHVSTDAEGNATMIDAAAIETARQSVLPLLQPVRVFDWQEGKPITLEATVIFKNALFRTKVLLATEAATVPVEEGDEGSEDLPAGGMRLFGEDLLLEDLPVYVDPPPGIYG